MTRKSRCVFCASFLAMGLLAQAGLERIDMAVRPALLRPIQEIPKELGEWIGWDEPVAADIIEHAETTEYLNRVYESRTRPGLQLKLWINYSKQGHNLRHSPEICLPSGGWNKIESQTKVMDIVYKGNRHTRITRLGYGRGELVEQVGFWYYIFGEGKLERFVRHLPVTSRGSYGRTARGSSMTVEVFYPGELDPDGESLQEFARLLLAELEAILPAERAEYHIP